MWTGEFAVCSYPGSYTGTAVFYTYPDASYAPRRASLTHHSSRRLTRRLQQLCRRPDRPCRARSSPSARVARGACDRQQWHPQPGTTTTRSSRQRASDWIVLLPRAAAHGSRRKGCRRLGWAVPRASWATRMRAQGASASSGAGSTVTVSVARAPAEAGVALHLHLHLRRRDRDRGARCAHPADTCRRSGAAR